MASYNWPPSSSNGVTSINTLVGDVTIAAGTGISITPSGQTLTLASTSAGDVTIAAFGSTPNANGLSINGSQVLNMQPGDATHPGGLSIAAQTIAGVKTFSSAPNLSSLTASTALVLDGSNNVASLAYTAVANASTLMSRDLNGTVSVNDLVLAVTQTTASGQTVNLNYGSAGEQRTTGSGNITFNMPDATTLYSNQNYYFNNNSTGLMTINKHDGSTLIGTIAAGGFALLNNLDNSVTNGTWDLHASLAHGSVSGTTNTTVPGTFTSDQIIDNGLTISTAVYADGSKQLASSSTTSTELGYVHGVTSAIQTQINAKGAGTVTSVGLSVPASSLFSVGSSPVTTSGTISIATAGTSGGVPYFDTTSTLNSSALLATKGIMLGGGAGAAPATLATDSSTTKVLTSGGSNTAPTWSAVTASSFGTQTAGTFLAGPNSGSAATPTFKALQTPTVQKFTSGSAATYTTAAGALYIKVRMVGGGGGGSSSGTAAGGAATDGGQSSFGTSLLTANGGVKGVFGADGGAGGASSLGSGPIGTASTGNQGGGSGAVNVSATTDVSGGFGGSTIFGGSGGGGVVQNGFAAIANSGSGGGGGGNGATAGAFNSSGAGGGAGGLVEAIIASPSATYTYTVGAAGSGGSAGTTGYAGGNGATGYIEVTEYYQ